MNLQLEQLGSLRKASVSVPKHCPEPCSGLGEKPDLVFKAPTYIYRDSKFLSTRQGGYHNSAVAELILFFLVLTVKIYRVRTIIDITGRLYSPVHPIRESVRSFFSKGIKNITHNLIFIKILLFFKDLNGVYPITTRNQYKFLLPSG